MVQREYGSSARNARPSSSWGAGRGGVSPFMPFSRAFRTAHQSRYSQTKRVRSPDARASARRAATSDARAAVNALVTGGACSHSASIRDHRGAKYRSNPFERAKLSSNSGRSGEKIAPSGWNKRFSASMHSYPTRFRRAANVAIYPASLGTNGNRRCLSGPFRTTIVKASGKAECASSISTPWPRNRGRSTTSRSNPPASSAATASLAKASLPRTYGTIARPGRPGSSMGDPAASVFSKDQKMFDLIRLLLRNGLFSSFGLRTNPGRGFFRFALPGFGSSEELPDLCVTRPVGPGPARHAVGELQAGPGLPGCGFRIPELLHVDFHPSVVTWGKVSLQDHPERGGRGDPDTDGGGEPPLQEKRKSPSGLLVPVQGGAEEELLVPLDPDPRQDRIQHPALVEHGGERVQRGGRGLADFVEKKDPPREHRGEERGGNVLDPVGGSEPCGAGDVLPVEFLLPLYDLQRLSQDLRQLVHDGVLSHPRRAEEADVEGFEPVARHPGGQRPLHDLLPLDEVDRRDPFRVGEANPDPLDLHEGVRLVYVVSRSCSRHVMTSFLPPGINARIVPESGGTDS